MLGEKRVNYWDANIFLAWLKREVRPDPNDMLGVEEQVRQYEAGQIIVVTSVLTITEILESTLDETAKQKFIQFQNRRGSYELLEVSLPIAKLASEIRNYYKETGPADYHLATPDSIHLATAILHRCDDFFTFDCNNKKKRGQNCDNTNYLACYGLIPLSNKVAGKHDLTIGKPPIGIQPKLPSNSLEL